MSFYPNFCIKIISLHFKDCFMVSRSQTGLQHIFFTYSGEQMFSELRKINNLNWPKYLLLRSSGKLMNIFKLDLYLK